MGSSSCWLLFNPKTEEGLFESSSISGLISMKVRYLSFCRDFFLDKGYRVIYICTTWQAYPFSFIDVSACIAEEPDEENLQGGFPGTGNDQEGTLPQQLPETIDWAKGYVDPASHVQLAMTSETIVPMSVRCFKAIRAWKELMNPAEVIVEKAVTHGKEANLFRGCPNFLEWR